MPEGGGEGPGALWRPSNRSGPRRSSSAGPRLGLLSPTPNLGLLTGHAVGQRALRSPDHQRCPRAGPSEPIPSASITGPGGLSSGNSLPWEGSATLRGADHERSASYTARVFFVPTLPGRPSGLFAEATHWRKRGSGCRGRRGPRQHDVATWGIGYGPSAKANWRAIPLLESAWSYVRTLSTRRAPR